MPALLTKKFKTLLAKQFYNLLDLGANAYLPEARRSYMYAFLGKQLPWNTGTEVPATPQETTAYINELFKRGIVAKQISSENSSLVIPRVDWKANTVYQTYEGSSNFYVLNSQDQVFKCLSNVSVGVASTDEPMLTLSTTSLEEPFLKTADGYKWKYMYTLNSLQKQKFLSEEWMPVAPNRFVVAAAQPGSIDIVNITNSGNNYASGATQNIITVVGDGADAALRAKVVAGKVTDIVIQNRGTNYTYANLTFRDVTGGVGSGAAATVAIAPTLGHGADPVNELGATTIMFNVEFDRTESGILPADNDFREIVLLHNPVRQGTTLSATEQRYTLYSRIKTSPGVGDFNNDEVVFQGTTLATATFTAEVISFDELQNLLYLNNVRGTLQVNQAIKGASTGAIRVVNSITEPTLKLYSGNVLYISDKLPIQRDLSQTERIRFILSF